MAAADGQVRSVERELAVVSAERDSLGAEKSALIATVRRLNGEVAKTDSLKASIMGQLSSNSAEYADTSYQRAAQTPALPSTLPMEPPSSPPPTSTTPAISRMPLPSPLSDTYAASPHPSSTYTPYTPYTAAFGAYSPNAAYSPAPPDSSPSAAFTRSTAVRGGGGGGEAHKGRVDGKEFFRQARAAPPTFAFVVRSLSPRERAKWPETKEAGLRCVRSDEVGHLPWDRRAHGCRRRHLVDFCRTSRTSTRSRRVTPRRWPPRALCSGRRARTCTKPSRA